MAEMEEIGTNLIADDFEPGPDFEIGRYNVIHPGCEVGANVRIRSGVELRPGTVVGDGCYLDSHVKSSGQNRIGDDVTLRYSAIVARGCDIGDNCYICPQVMTNNVDQRREQVGGADVGADCFVGTQAVLGAGIEIAAGTTVGACSFVHDDIDEPGTFVGVPARRI